MYFKWGIMPESRVTSTQPAWENRLAWIVTEMPNRANFPSMHTVLMQTQLRWAGHVFRMAGHWLPKKLLFDQFQHVKCTRGGCINISLRSKQVRTEQSGVHLFPVAQKPMFCNRIAAAKKLSSLGKQWTAAPPRPQEQPIFPIRAAPELSRHGLERSAISAPTRTRFYQPQHD